MKSLMFLLPTAAMLILTIHTEAHHHKCPWHSHYSLCMDLCPKRCNQPKEVGCSNACVPGCTCNPGYELNSKGKCVHPRRCLRDPIPPPPPTSPPATLPPPPPIACPLGSHYERCEDTCPKRCNEPQPLHCDLRCTEGCDCDAGLELNLYGRCVPPHQCEPHLPPNNNCLGDPGCHGDLVADITVHIHGKNLPRTVEKHEVQIPSLLNTTAS